MDSNELAEIDASARALVRRAYDLGRTEALKRVVDVLSGDGQMSEQLALMAPEHVVSPVHQSETNGVALSEKAPWWAWPVR